MSSTETFNLQTDKFDKIAKFFYTNGFVILENALSEELIARPQKERKE